MHQSYPTPALLHFYEGGEGFQHSDWPRPPFLSNEAYGLATQTFVIVCSDTVAIDRQRRGFWLTRRIVHATKGPWGFGGRWMRGETHIDAAIRTVGRETSLVLAPERLQLVLILSGFWQYRKLPPQDLGEQNIIFVHTVELTRQERDQASRNLDANEYDLGHGLQFYDRNRLVTECKNRPLAEYYDLIFN